MQSSNFLEFFSSIIQIIAPILGIATIILAIYFIKKGLSKNTK